jgi:hypothetical protein
MSCGEKRGIDCESDEVAAPTVAGLGLPTDRMSLVSLRRYPDLEEYDVTGAAKLVIVWPDRLGLGETPHFETGFVSSRIEDARIFLF